MYKLIAVSILSALIMGCGSSDNTNSTPKPKKPKTTTEPMAAQFSSIPSCLKGIEKQTKSTLRIVTDKSDEVSGVYGNKKLFFSCQVKESGSQGTSVKGWYMVEVEVF